MNLLIAHYSCLVLSLKWKHHIKQFQNNDFLIQELLWNNVKKKSLKLLETKQEIEKGQIILLWFLSIFP